MTREAPRSLYNEEVTARYAAGAPHLTHKSLRRLFATLSLEAYAHAATFAPQPHVLDLGAGQGAATLAFLELGAYVTAVDDSESQLRVLQKRCNRYSDRLDVDLDDAMDALDRLVPRYDVVVASSFLHHVPDYRALVRRATRLMSSHSVFFSFQDPLQYASLSTSTLILARLAYAVWRAQQPDVLGGLGRRARRARGIYLENCSEDWIEYHATRGGVDVDAVVAELEDEGFQPRVITYFSTQSGFFQRLGERLGLETTFAIVAVR